MKKEDKKKSECQDNLIKKLVDDHNALSESRASLEEEIKDKNRQMAAIESKIKEWMELHSLDSFVADGSQVVLKPEVRGKVHDPVAFFEYLAARNEADLVSLKLPPNIGKQFKEWAENNGVAISGIDVSIAWNSLTRYIKENCDVTDAGTWPAGLDVEAWDRVVIKKK